jgi:Ca2+-binding EF-hand superfamily protein
MVLKFKNLSHIKLMTQKYISSAMLNQDELDELKDTFFALNTSFTGDLSRHELITAYWNNGYKSMTEYELDGIFSTLDDDGSGLLSFNEFLVCAIKSS